MATYYVGSGGSDTNAGTTYAARFLTLAKAATTVSAGGDIVYVSPGTYREALTISVSGGNAYSTGTIAVTNGSTTVTGTGTTFTGGNVVAGYFLKTGKSAPILISAVNTTTELILSTPYDGPTESGITYITYNPIKWIGDYSGANTDGVGGVVRITGSADDITATRANCILSTSKNYNHITGFTFDICSSLQISLTTCQYWLIEKCYSQAGDLVTAASANFLGVSGATQLGITVKNCFTKSLKGTNIYFSHSVAVDNAGHMVQNCIFVGNNTAGVTGNASYGVGSARVGGIIVKNCDISGVSVCVGVATAVTVGQTVTVNNCVLHDTTQLLVATVTGEIIENFNDMYNTGTARTNVAIGADSITYPTLWDTRWFFETVA